MRAVLAEPGRRSRRCTDSPTSRSGSSGPTPNFGRLYLRASGVTLGELVSKIDQAVVENYTEAMNLQTKLFRDGQDAGELREGDPEVLAMLFSGLLSAYQSTDPTVVTAADATERMTVAELHEIIDGAFAR